MTFEISELTKLIANVLRIDESKIGIDTKRYEIEEWDSLAHLHLIIEIEEKFKVSFPIEAIPEIKSVKDILNYLPINK